jgi:hypothetical protein
MFNKLKQFKELRDQAKSLKDQLGKETVTGEAAGGKITVVMDGNQEILSLDIDPALLAPDKKEEVERGVKDAIAHAIRQVQKLMAKKLSDGQISMPNLS